MRWTRAVAGLLAVTMAGGSALADEAEANRLLVEAIGLAQQAARAPREEAVALYAQAVANLDAIVADHPDSSHAVLIATHQPIGAFRAWEVRHELARLTASAGPAAPVQPAAVEPWEHRFGDGRGNILTGDPAWFLTDLLARGDGTAVTVGSYWHDSEKDIWLAAFAADGARLWERTYTGMPCGAALIEDGIAVVAHDMVEGQDSGVLMVLDDGLAPTGFGVAFEPYGIAPDGSGGFLVFGAADGQPIAQRFRADGDTVWTWSAPAEIQAEAVGGAVTAAVPVPGSTDMRLLGHIQPADAGAQEAVVWTAVAGDDGSVRDVAMLGEITLTSGLVCDFVLHLWSIDAAGDGFIVRYDFVDAPSGMRRSVVARLDATGQELWRQRHPTDAAAQRELDPEALREHGVDEVTAVSATADGGVLVAGFRRRPAGFGAGFVSRWDEDGNVVWSTELRRTPADEAVSDAYFAAVEEAADGGVLAVMSDGVIYMRPRAFVFRLGADGTPP